MNAAVVDKSESQKHLSFIRLIAEASDVPNEEVEQIYNVEFEKLKKKARVSNFLPVLAGNKTKEILRRMQRGSLA